MPYANIWLSARTMVCECAVGIKYLAMHYEVGGSVATDVTPAKVQLPHHSECYCIHINGHILV